LVVNLGQGEKRAKIVGPRRRLCEVRYVIDTKNIREIENTQTERERERERERELPKTENVLKK